MREYIADKKLGKKLYHQKRKLYKRYKIGMIAMLVFLLLMILLNLRNVQEAESNYQMIEILFVGIGFDVVFIIGACFARALAISGGREVLMSRMSEKCMFTDDYFVLAYVPHVHETTQYERIQFQIRYSDIEKIEEEDLVGRLAIYGAYKTLKYRTVNSEERVDSYMVSDMPLYVYGYYEEFDSLKKELRKKVQ